MKKKICIVTLSFLVIAFAFSRSSALNNFGNSVNLHLYTGYYTYKRNNYFFNDWIGGVRIVEDGGSWVISQKRQPKTILYQEQEHEKHEKK